MPEGSCYIILCYISLNTLVLNVGSPADAFRTINLIFSNPFNMKSYPVFVNSVHLMALNLCRESCVMFYRLLILRSCSLSKMCGPNGRALHHSCWIWMYPRLLAELHSTRGGSCERLQTAFEVHNCCLEH